LPAVPCFLIFGSSEAIIIAHWAQQVPDRPRWSYRINRLMPPQVMDGRTSHLGTTFFKCWSVRSARLWGAKLKEFYCSEIVLLCPVTCSTSQIMSWISLTLCKRSTLIDSWLKWFQCKPHITQW
jgi:hypothetical protein